ncbi:MAG: ribosome silencing factor [Rhizobiales bacterium]|nr:ribosome silencing factor [Hyphomicrobiales bacterium]
MKAPAKKAAAPKAAAKPKAAANDAATATKKPARARSARTSKPVKPDLLKAVLDQLDDAKAEAIVTISLDGKAAIADTMVVASGRSNRHVGAIADQLVEKLKAAGHRNLRVEGLPQCDWVLVDAGDVVVHVFRPEVRSFYNLEKLWSEHAPQERLAV